MKIRLAALFAVLALSLPVAGCWDRHELQERSFVMAAAIDVAGAAKEKESGAANVEDFPLLEGRRKYRLSLQILELAPPPKGQTREAKSAKTFVIATDGDSLFQMIEDLQGQADRQLYFEHIQSIIISEAAIREGLEPIIDWFHRDAELRWRTKVFITPGRAADILNYKPPSGEAGGMYLAKSAEMYFKDPFIAGSHTDLGYVTERFDQHASLVIPRLDYKPPVLKMGGMAVFKNGRFAGYLDGYATQGGKFLMGIEKSALIVAPCPNHPAYPVTFELFRHDTRLTPHIDGDSIYFTCDIYMMGNLGENQCDGMGDDTSDPAYIRKLEAAFAQEVKKNILYARQAYWQLGLSPPGFQSRLKAHAPATWEKVKDRWDNIFPTIPLILSVNVTIRNLGTHK
ncbi:spore germination gerac [Lucifera butyrica]|uniref:Spore germination gerac n=1 Tax=Lucifera butyrica TaxID=1351585 RepID=A0A498R6B1_9FIRM|nr:Ger(x)C family spore germination protein [Lucifera butyrica]VBB06397.1 spore germination gerac [Lucifera butyrica]